MADQPWLVGHLLATIRCFENPKLPGFCQEVVGQILSLKVSLAVAFLPLASHRSLDFIFQGKEYSTSFEPTDDCNDSIERIDKNCNEVHHDDQSGDNVALLALVRGLFNLEQLVNAFYHFEHDAAKDGEELRKKDEPLKFIQTFVEVGVHGQVQAEEPVLQ